MILRALLLAAAVAGVASDPAYAVAGIQLVRTHASGSTLGYVVRVVTVGALFTEDRTWSTLHVKAGNADIEIRKPTSSVFSGLYGYWDTNAMPLTPGTIVTARAASSSFSRTVPQASDPRVVDGVALSNVTTFAFMSNSAPMNISTWVAVCDAGIGNRVTVRPGQAVPADAATCDVTAVYDRLESEISPPFHLVLKDKSSAESRGRQSRGAILLSVVFWTWL